MIYIPFQVNSVDMMDMMDMISPSHSTKTAVYIFLSFDFSGYGAVLASFRVLRRLRNHLVFQLSRPRFSSPLYR
jgi:hypothetical protein